MISHSVLPSAICLRVWLREAFFILKMGSNSPKEGSLSLSYCLLCLVHDFRVTYGHVPSLREEFKQDLNGEKGEGRGRDGEETAKRGVLAGVAE